MSFAIRVEGLSKRYKLGMTHSGSVKDLVSTAMRRILRRPDPVPLGSRAAPSPECLDDDGRFWALRDVSFEVKPGDIFGIIGRNGAGKSTLLKILSRITAPTHGRVEMNGRVSSLLEVGTGFHPELSGRENVFLNGALLGLTKSEIRKKFDDIVAFAEVEQFIDTPVKRYSSGMYVRLAFAVAAHLEPEILIVDEVLAVGDSGFQKKCLGKIGEVGRDGRTVLIVSHNMPVISNLCQRAMLLKAGTIHSNGLPMEVISGYLKSNASSTGEILWPSPTSAPGNELVRLHAVRILQPGLDGATNDVDISKEVVIQITYWNLSQGTDLYAAIWLKDHAGVPVLASASSVVPTTDPWHGKPHPIGLFCSECRLPGSFLNEGRYYITPIVGKRPGSTLVLLEDLLAFDVHDTGEMRAEYYGPWIGTVRPKLPWSSSFLPPLPENGSVKTEAQGNLNGSHSTFPG